MKKKIRCPYFELNDLERAYHDKAELRQAIRNAARRHFARRRGDAARLSCEEMEGMRRYARGGDLAFPAYRVREDPGRCAHPCGRLSLLRRGRIPAPQLRATQRLCICR